MQQDANALLKAGCQGGVQLQRAGVRAQRCLQGFIVPVDVTFFLVGTTVAGCKLFQMLQRGERALTVPGVALGNRLEVQRLGVVGGGR